MTVQDPRPLDVTVGRHVARPGWSVLRISFNTANPDHAARFAAALHVLFAKAESTPEPEQPATPEPLQPLPMAQQWIWVESSNIAAIRYEDAMGWLLVRFKRSDDVWCYSDVPYEVFEAFCAVPSKGSYFAAHIRSAFTSRKLASAEIPD